MRKKIACLSVASLLFLANFDKSEICFLENLILRAIYFIHYLLLHYYKHLVLMSFLTPSIKYLHCHICCNAVQSSAWLLHYIKIKKLLLLKCFSLPIFQLIIISVSKKLVHPVNLRLPPLKRGINYKCLF